MKEVKADSTAPDIVVTKGLVVAVEVLDVVVWEVRVAVSSDGTEKLLTPGEQPTKFGADSLTELQVAILNAIAPAYHQKPSRFRSLSYLLPWSEGAHEVAKQQDSAFT